MKETIVPILLAAGRGSRLGLEDLPKPIDLRQFLNEIEGKSRPFVGRRNIKLANFIMLK